MSTVTTQITAEEYSRMHFDVPTELVRGEIYYPYGEDGMTRPGYRHGIICVNVAVALTIWNKKSRLGRIASNDSWITTHHDPDSVRGADVAYMREDRLPEGKVPDGPSDAVPNLCVEVVSPSNSMKQMREKAAEYLAAGAEEVWIVDPKSQTVQVYRQDSPPRLFDSVDELTSAVLPEFKVPVSEFFADV
jgi:Uma2 family endonuclease